MNEIRLPETPKNRCRKWMSQECIPGLVSVIIPTYNCAHFLVEAMDSVLAQSHRPIEIIIVDDGSTDNTSEIVEKWGKRFTGDYHFELRYVYQENSGSSAARNLGLTESKGEYIQFLDADDVLSPRKLVCQVSALSSCGYKTAAYGPWRHFQNVGNRLAVYKPHGSVDGDDLLQKWITGWFLGIHSLLWKRADVKRLGPWDESLATDEDGEYAMRFLANGGKLLFCEQAWVYYRQNPNSVRDGNRMSRKSNPGSIRSRIRVAWRVERFLARAGLLDNGYRHALSQRYYEIAKYYTTSNHLLRRLCLRNFRRLSPDGHVPGTWRYRVLTKIFGFVVTQKLRFFFLGRLHIPTHFPVAKVRAIEELRVFDQPVI